MIAGLTIALAGAPTVTLAAAAAAPTGGRIAVLEATKDSDCSSNVQLRTIKPDGSDPQTLTFASGDGAVEWSPDGTTIAYDYGSTIRTIKADGSDDKLFANGGKYPTWSPDGTQLAYAAVVGGHSVIVRQPIAGGSAVQVEPLDPSKPYDSGTRSDGSTYDAYATGDQTPAWSPSGDRIVFQRLSYVSYHAANGTDIGSAQKFDIYSTRVDGSGLKQLTGDNAAQDQFTPNAAINQLPTWSPDGSTVAFSFDRSNAPPNYYGFQVATVPASGGPTTLGPVVYYPRNDRIVLPEYSPSGQLAYAANKAYSGVQGPAYGIYVDGAMIYEAPHGICGFGWSAGATSIPSASFKATLTGAAPHEWSFDASASRSAGGKIKSYRWVFGDGTTETTSIPTTTHTYADGKPHTASLSVVDANGATSAPVSHVLTEPALVVNSVGDDPALKASAGCDTGATVGADDVPECTLRAAIEALDAGTGSTITFSLPAGSTTITPGTPLPKITAAGASIDGSSQPSGTPTIAGAGLVINGAAGVTVKGLSVVAAPDIAIDFKASPHGTVRGCSVGVRANGTPDPGRAGIYVSDSPGTTIGGKTSGAGNVVGGTSAGIVITSSASVSVIGNSVGVTASGTTIADGSGEGVLALTRSGSIPGLVIEDNTIAGQTHNLTLIGAGVQAPRITHNRVGVNAAATARVGAPTDNIRLDGVPDATIDSNTVAGAVNDIFVAGSVQTTFTTDGTDFYLVYHKPDDPISGQPVTGIGDHVSGNNVGLVPGAGSATEEGIRIWEAASDTTVSDNIVAGHTSDEIRVSGGTAISVTGNTVGLGASGASSLAGIVVTSTPSVHVTTNTVGAVGAGIRVASSSGATVSGNTIGFGRDGASAAAVTTGISVLDDSPDATVGPDNVIGNAQTALVLYGKHPRVIGNRIGAARFGAAAAHTGTGILVQTPTTDAVIGEQHAGNVIVNTTIGIDVEVPGSTVAYNKLGAVTSGAAANATGILVRADASVHDNSVANSSVAGITVDGTHIVTLRRNAVYATATLAGITGAPAAPTVDGAVRVQHGTSIRTWLVIKGLPSSGPAGTLEIFGNMTCADPEGRVPLFTLPTHDQATRVVSIPGRGDLKGITVTYTDAAGTTSGFSSCADAVAGPDSDGDGIPDLVEANAPVPTDSSAQFASFVADNQQWVILQTVAPAKLTGVAPLDDPHPADHPGITFPVGLLTFAVEGLDKGANASVGVALPGGSTATGWTKYGPASAPRYYGFGYDEATKTGAGVSSQTLGPLGPSTFITLIITDGGRGDDDGTADGRIVDPGGPSVGAVGPGPVAPSSAAPTSKPATVAPSAPAHDSVSSAGEPAQTGVDLRDLIAVGLLALLAGSMLSRIRRRPGSGRGGLPAGARHPGCASRKR